jgi:hypothetical protein
MYFVAGSEFLLSLAMPSPSARHSKRAIIRSSSVRMTRTVARLASVELASRGLRIVRRIPHLRPGLDANPVFFMRFGNGSKVLAQMIDVPYSGTNNQ